MEHMPELPWIAWYPQLWLSESGLSLCSAATRGVWVDVLNHMLVSGVSTIEGSKHQLAVLCRCRPQEIEVAAIELDKYKVAIVRWQGDGIALTSRRVRRDLKIKYDKRNAGIKGAAKRWQTGSKGGMAASISTSVSVPEGVQGEPYFEQAMERVPIQLREQVKLDFARMVFRSWNGRDGKDGGGVNVRFEKLLQKRWDSEGEQWRNGCHSAQKKAQPAQAIENQI